jgi:hypothetical protein
VEYFLDADKFVYLMTFVSDEAPIAAMRYFCTNVEMNIVKARAIVTALEHGQYEYVGLGVAVTI